MPHNTQCAFGLCFVEKRQQMTQHWAIFFFLSSLSLSQHPALSFSFRYGQCVMMAHFDYIEDVCWGRCIVYIHSWDDRWCKLTVRKRHKRNPKWKPKIKLKPYKYIQTHKNVALMWWPLLSANSNAEHGNGDDCLISLKWNFNDTPDIYNFLFTNDFYFDGFLYPCGHCDRYRGIVRRSAFIHFS